MAFSTEAAKKIALKGVAKILNPARTTRRFIKKDVMINESKQKLAEKAAAIPLGAAKVVGENTFRFTPNEDSLLGFNINLTKRAKVIAGTGIVGSIMFDVATMQTNNIGPTENGVKTATPSLGEYLDPSYSQAPSYANANADGDLVLALNKNRNG